MHLDLICSVFHKHQPSTCITYNLLNREVLQGVIGRGLPFSGFTVVAFLVISVTFSQHSEKKDRKKKVLATFVAD